MAPASRTTRKKNPASNATESRSEQASAKGDLGPYRSMRDFSVTPEPSGEKASAGGEKLRFVIQKHAASHLHYDLRLELDGVFKSWAVAKGPSLDPHQKRLAIHVEDHPLDYGDFEGIIPKGEYGGGTVMIWDRGFWAPVGDAGKGYKKGHLAFDLDGEKLHGRWHLIRTKAKPGEKKQQWLLFKSEDEFSKAAGEEDILLKAPDSAATGRRMDEIAEEKSAVWSSRGGLVTGELTVPEPEKTSSKRRSKTVSLSRPEKSVIERGGVVSPNKIKGAKRSDDLAFIPPCLALLADTPPAGDDWLHEIKFDGYRLICVIEDGEASLFTRSGLDWSHRFPSIALALQDFPASNAIVDGEAVVEDDNGVSSFSALQAALADGRPAKEASLYAFDLLHIEGYDLRGAALEDRKSALEALLKPIANQALSYSGHIVANGDAMKEHACRLGLEGVISKRRNAPYLSGRHGEWIKTKCTNRSEFVVGGYTPSTATRGAIGSLALGYYQGGDLIHVGRTGTGFTQKLARSLYRRLQGLREPKPPFANALTAEERRGLVFVKPELVAEVEFPGWTHDRHLRHAAFKGLREDKPAAEVHLEEAKSVSDKNKEAASDKDIEASPMKKGGKSGSIEFEGVTLTHPDRVLWEAQGLTKLGLAEYYAGIADYILPHLTGRPLALVRCPSGSEGECFFQKHAFNGLTDAVEVAQVPEKEGMDETLIIHDLRGLISLVQANVLEIHPWGAMLEDVERPDRLIFDLDPGQGVGWDGIVEGALEVKERLDEAGVESFVKLTGGKGVHVMAVLKPELGWDELKDFTHRIALAMEADSPAKYISTMTKKARSGKIFVDYLRNGRGATAVAAYSTRARPNAPVSAPIRWNELGPGMTPNRFNISNLPRRLSSLKSDPWEGFFSSPQTINKAALQANKKPSRARAVKPAKR